jgi:transglutaminase-like putative cysteine protease
MYGKKLMKKYLSSSAYIDADHPLIKAKARELSKGCESEELAVKHCFEFVRDHIKHSWDYRMNPVTCKASDVLIAGTGYCFAKSHLLAALLRANGIPAGLCYQRLRLSDDNPSYCLHGLNSVYLKQHGWYRIDPRGNKRGIDAQFCPPTEKLAFPVMQTEERLYPQIFSEPLSSVIAVLTTQTNVDDVFNHLPDALEL